MDLSSLSSRELIAKAHAELDSIVDWLDAIDIEQQVCSSVPARRDVLALRDILCEWTSRVDAAGLV